MTRTGGPARSALTALLLAAGAMAAPCPATAEAVGADAAGDCRPLALVDAASGRPLVGIEDIAVDAHDRVAYLSVQDRWSLEAAVDARADALPQGGIYRLSAARLAASRDGPGVQPLRLDNLVAMAGGEDGFHPHGIALLRDGEAPLLIAAVNRRYRREPSGGAAWHRADRIEIFAAGPRGLRHRASLETPLLCRPNDLAWLDPGRLLVTSDRASCSGPGHWLETLLGGDGTLVRADLTEDSELAEVQLLADGLPYANGVVVDRAAGQVLTAATRDSAIHALPLDRLAGTPSGRQAHNRIAVDGGPDNLTLPEGGPLLVALHSSLLRLGLYRHRLLGVERAPSRIVALCGADRRPTTLFEDPDGTLFPAATVAALLGDHLLVGSVTAPGLLACRRAGGVCGEGVR